MYCYKSVGSVVSISHLIKVLVHIVDQMTIRPYLLSEAKMILRELSLLSTRNLILVCNVFFSFLSTCTWSVSCNCHEYVKRLMLRYLVLKRGTIYSTFIVYANDISGNTLGGHKNNLSVWVAIICLPCWWQYAICSHKSGMPLCTYSILLVLMVTASWKGLWGLFFRSFIRLSVRKFVRPFVCLFVIAVTRIKA